MRTPRSHLLSKNAVGSYHCVSRCVRRAFLCGDDAATGRSLGHRKHWIENRLLELANLFAVDIYAYAVMSNHVHVVVRIDPAVAEAWSSDDIAERWTRLFPVRENGQVDAGACRICATMIAEDPNRVAVYRERLSSLSWFMRCLNEPIARMANREDACTGRFWEGRYKCQALLDEAAVLACMSYVDLNPVRAGTATDLRSSHHTSIRRRLTDHCDGKALLQPISGATHAPLSLCVDDYLALVEWTGRRLYPGKRGRIETPIPRCSALRGVEPAVWLAGVSSIESRYWRAIGSVDALIGKAREWGQRWLKGIGTRRVVERLIVA